MRNNLALVRASALFSHTHMSLSFPSRLFAKTAVILGLFFGLASTGLHAETRTLTDQMGRSLKAELVSLDGDTLTIKREDGQTFTLSLATLSDDDQKSIKDWAATQVPVKPKPLSPDAIKVTLSRGIFKTDIRKVEVKLIGGGTVKNGMTVTEDKWGYTVTLENRTPKPVPALRAEYRLFATVDDIQVKATKKSLKKKACKTAIEAIPELGRTTFQTETISATKTHYNGNIVSAGSGESSSRETLYGIWIRIYDGDNLLYEEAFPGTLKTTETW